jgi:hypothetical protein
MDFSPFLTGDQRQFNLEINLSIIPLKASIDHVSE